MKFDLMVSGTSWAQMATLARSVERAGFSGLVVTETTEAPWMSLAAAAMATESLELSTGIVVAFARSPMVSATMAWELAANSAGRFRLGLGSQVRAHVERRYGMPFDPPGPRMRDYLRAVKACFAAFGGTEALDHRGPYYDLTLLPPAWKPSAHPYGDIKVDVAAVNPWMCAMAGEVADGIHVHPLHSRHYLAQRLVPAVSRGATAAGRTTEQIDLIVPVFAVPGDTPEARAPLLARARAQIAFYGSTANYSFQFDDLGYEGTSARLHRHLKAGEVSAMAEVITDEILEHFAVVAPWDGLAGALLQRYRGTANRLVMYLAQESLEADPLALGRWGEVARAVTTGSPE